MIWNRKVFWLGVAIVFFVVYVFSFWRFGASYTQALGVAVAVAGIYVFGRVLWRTLRLYRVLEWIARHSPFRKLPKSMAIILIAFFLVASLFVSTLLIVRHMSRPPDAPKLTYTEFVEKAQKGGIAKYVILKHETQISQPTIIAFFTDLTDGKNKWTYFPNAPAYIPQVTPEEWLRLLEYNVEPKYPFSMTFPVMQILQGFTYSIPFFFFLWFIAGGGLRGVGEELSAISHAKIGLKETITFKDVAGIDHAVDSVRPYVNYLRNPTRYKKFKAKISKGILLHGEPGVGKSLLARALAGEAGVPIYKVSGSDFHFMLVGVGAARAETIFNHAIRTAPSIVIVDEIDSAGGKRGGIDIGGAGKERDSLVNKFNSILDRLSNEDIPVIVVGTTNLLEALDESLFRDGRFDVRVHIPLPDEKGRRAILKIHLVDPDPDLISDDVNIDDIIRRTRNWPGSKLANLANFARIKAAEKNAREKVQQEDILEAWEFVLFGPETKVDLSEKEFETVKYHEVGHALASLALPEADPSEYVTTRTHGGMLGHAFPLAEREYHLEGRTRFLTMVKVLLAGRAVEIVRNGEPSTGAKDDLEKATTLVRRMVFELGMDEEIGPVVIDKVVSSSRRYGQLGNGHSILVEEGEKRVQAIIQECSDEMQVFFTSPEVSEVLEKIAERLSVEKTLVRSQLEAIIPREMLERRTAKVS